MRQNSLSNQAAFCLKISDDGHNDDNPYACQSVTIFLIQQNRLDEI